MDGLTKFSAIKPKGLPVRIKAKIKENKDRIARLVKTRRAQQINWDNTAQLLDDWDEELMENLFAPVSHLKSVAETKELRDAYNQALPLVTAYQTDLKQNRQLYRLLSHLRQTSRELTEAQKKQLDDALLSCRLTGIDLPPRRRKEYKRKVQELRRLCTRFSENVLDATQRWSKHIIDKKKLVGVPEATLRLLRQNAQSVGKKGYLLGLHLPLYLPIIRYADNENLRREIYSAYMTRASDLGYEKEKYDNSSLTARILALRYEIAAMHGYKTAAEMLMVRNMVRSSREVEYFFTEYCRAGITACKKRSGRIVRLRQRTQG